MQRIMISLLASLSLGSAAFAACPPKSVAHSWNLESGDQRVSGDFAAKHMVGKKVHYSNPTGRENYGADGSYSYKDKGGTYVANGYRFYSDGSRCLDYGNGPRHDLYVVRDGKFWLVNTSGGRYQARISN